MGFFATRPFNSPLLFSQASAYLFVGPTSCQPATKTAQVTIYFYWEALGSSGQRVDDKRSEESMMEDLEKTKPVDAAPADDDETGAGCDVCMPPIALVGAEDYDYKYLCMPSMVRARVRPSTCERGDGAGSVRHRRDASLPRSTRRSSRRRCRRPSRSTRASSTAFGRVRTSRTR